MNVVELLPELPQSVRDFLLLFSSRFPLGNEVAWLEQSRLLNVGVARLLLVVSEKVSVMELSLLVFANHGGVGGRWCFLERSRFINIHNWFF